MTFIILFKKNLLKKKKKVLTYFIIFFRLSYGRLKIPRIHGKGIKKDIYGFRRNTSNI